MILSLSLNLQVIRLLLLLFVLVGLGGLAKVGYAQYLVAALGEQEARVDRELLAQAAQRVPDSARLQAQLADFTLAQGNDLEAASVEASAAALRAVQLSPYNVDFRLLLAATQSVSGDLAARESHLRKAVELAPHYPRVRWQLANLLVREGKLEAAIAEFRQVVDANPSLLGTALDLLWQASGENLDALTKATGEQPRNQFALANFLLQQNRPEAAAQIFSRVSLAARAAAPETADFLTRLMNAGQPEQARRFWGEARGIADLSALLYQGDFETEPAPKFALFEWQLKRSEYASPKIEAGTARSGARALRVDFAGRDTTKLTDEVRQLIVLQSQTAYRLTCYVKTGQFKAPEGPRWVVSHYNTLQPLAVTNPLSLDQNDWQAQTADFVTPAGQKNYWLTLQRTPQLSYDEPTRGTLWFDDCSVTEITRAEAR